MRYSYTRNARGLPTFTLSFLKTLMTVILLMRYRTILCSSYTIRYTSKLERVMNITFVLFLYFRRRSKRRLSCKSGHGLGCSFGCGTKKSQSIAHKRRGCLPCFEGRPAVVALAFLALFCFLGGGILVLKLYLLLAHFELAQVALHAASLPNAMATTDFVPCLRVLLSSQPADVSANSEREGSKLCI